MTAFFDDTICAIATPPGSGAIAIIRLSGKDSYSVCSRIIRFPGKKKQLHTLEANTIHHASVVSDNTLIDDVLISLFRAPHSYTGEDVIEISCHGGLYIQQKILELVVQQGARLAKPGEFTQRAFLNRKIDLSQAEAVADLIASGSKAAHNLAMNQMKGGFSREIAGLRERLLNFISLIELELDFSEEDVEFADRTKLAELIEEICKLTDSLVSSFQMGNAIRNGIPVAIAGKTNVGKSTLLNALLHDERAIVSEIAGTTRDVIEDVITIEGYSFRFIDTAGLRKTSDSIESIGIEKAYERIKKAHVVLYVIDATIKTSEIDRLAGKIKKRLSGSNQRLIFILNMIDFLNDEQLSLRKDLRNFRNLVPEDKILYISALYGENIDQLTAMLVAQVQQSKAGDHEVIVTNTRHYEALVKAKEALERVKEGLLTRRSSEFIAMDTREILHYLGEITGEVTSDEILGNIFIRFCIGK